MGRRLMAVRAGRLALVLFLGGSLVGSGSGKAWAADRSSVAAPAAAAQGKALRGKDKRRVVGPLELLGANEVLRGQFVEEHVVPKLNKTVQTEGRFVFAPQRGILWQMIQPMPMTVVITARGVEQSIAGVPLVRATVAQMPYLERMPRLLLAMLRGEWGALTDEFEVASSPQGKGWRAVLVPRKESNVRALFSSLTLSGGRFVQEAEAVRRNGYKDRFVFSDLARTSAPLAEDEALLFDQVEASQPVGSVASP